MQDDEERREALRQGRAVEIAGDLEITIRHQEIGDDNPIQASTSRGVQDWLKSQISDQYRRRGYWPDTPDGYGRAVQDLEGASAIPALPVKMTPVEALNLWTALAAKSRTIRLDEGHASDGVSHVTATAQILDPKMKDIFNGFDKWRGKPTIVDTAKPVTHKPLGATYTMYAPVGDPPTYASPAAGIPSTSILTPQATWDFLYYADKLAIGLDSLNGIPSDNALLWWAVVETAKDTARTVANTATKVVDTVKAGLGIVPILAGGAVIVGGLFLWSRSKGK